VTKRLLVDLTEAGEMLGTTYWGAYSLVQKGVLSTVRLPNHRRVFVDVRDIERLIDANKTKVAA
jgi:hypothetical protein